MDKKIELIVGDKVVRVMPHMVDDMLRFGATRMKKVIRNVPKELLSIPEVVKLPEADPLPAMETVKAKADDTIQKVEPAKAFEKKPSKRGQKK
jgi:hypothetical protein